MKKMIRKLSALLLFVVLAMSMAGGAFAENQEEMKILYICRNLIQFLRMQIRASLLREESRGVFNRTDFPDPDAAWEKNIIFRMQKGQLITDIKDADEGDEAC